MSAPASALPGLHRESAAARERVGSQPARLDNGGLIDRSRRLRFTFDGRGLEGHPGDTLASALLANDVRLVGRSFKYHRPRGIYSAGVEEPNALVTIDEQGGDGGRTTPNVRATVAELYAGLDARSQNHRGSLRFDAMAVNDLLAPFLGAGFYYKTFMWPKAFWERVYEPAIRAAAGLGALSGEPDADVYDHGFLHAELLIVGAGPAGLVAALAAGRAGVRTLLVDDAPTPGGRLLSETYRVDGLAGPDWAARATAELDALDNVRRLSRTCVHGVYDGHLYGAVESVTDHLPPPARGPRQIHWKIRASRALLCAGAIERGMAFADNDRPGVMLAGAVRSYVNRHAVAPGRQTAVFTNNDDGWRTARDLVAAGLEVTAVIDARDADAPEGGLPGVEHVRAGRIVGTSGRHRLHAVTLADGRRVHADCLAVAGGWNPALHLSCHLGARPAWSGPIAAFVPGDALPDGMRVVGAANGTLSLGASLREAHGAAAEVARALGRAASSGDAPVADDESVALEPIWHVPAPKGRRAWVDLQNDVTVKDIALAHAEGFHAAEHLKRYTTLGMATDQGKTSGVLGLAIMAERTGRTIAETGTTMFRPPYVPVAIGAIGGRDRGKHHRPVRRTPAHRAAEAFGASFVESGPWLRAEWFARAGERGWRDAVDREVRTVREAVGVGDVSTLGKIDVQGVDAGAFLDRVYANTMSTLAVGKVRYGLMLREDGFVMDDGTAARLTEHRYLVTTTTANAVGVFRHMEFCHQCLWPELDVHLVPATDQWAQFAVAGPRSRELVSRVVDRDVSNEAFGFMACAEVTVLGVPGRLFRISFSGELAYEIAVPARCGDALFEALLDAGADLGVAPYGLEALNVLRVEKGHCTVAELDGRVTAAHVGLGRMVSHKKDSIGRVLAQREALVADDAWRLVGLTPEDGATPLRAGSHLVDVGAPVDLAHDLGYVTSVAFSPTLGHPIALGFLRRGDARHGEVVRMVSPLHGEDVRVRVGGPVAFDPDGVRTRG